jgi:hypothetical protein
MRLPNAERAFIDPAKVRDYLLSSVHSVGRFKATFFLSMGYTNDQWQKLRDDLLALAVSGDALPGRESGFGRKFEVSGMLTGPSGRSAEIRTVWIVADEEAAPRFVTAYPR